MWNCLSFWIFWNSIAMHHRVGNLRCLAEDKLVCSVLDKVSEWLWKKYCLGILLTWQINSRLNTRFLMKILNFVQLKIKYNISVHNYTNTTFFRILNLETILKICDQRHLLGWSHREAAYPCQNAHFSYPC